MALPQVGHAGQERIAGACVVIVGSELACEIAARALSAAGVGRLRLVRGGDGGGGSDGGGDGEGASSALLTDLRQALVASNPELAVEIVPWPERRDAGANGERAQAAAWRDRLAGASALVGLAATSASAAGSSWRAARDLGIPAVSMRSGRRGLAVASLEAAAPSAPGAGAGSPPGANAVEPSLGDADAGAVVAGHLAAAEVLLLLAGATGATAAHAARPRGIEVDLPAAVAGPDGAAPPPPGIQAGAVPDER